MSRFAVCGIAVFALATVGTTSADPAQIKKLTTDLMSGPGVYQTSAALDYHATKQGVASQPPMPEQNAKGLAMLRAAMVLGDMGPKASEALEALVTVFPVGVHASTVYENFRSGEGSVEDFVMTKIMGEKNKFLMSAPFLSYEHLSRCERFLDIKHDYTLSNQIQSGGRLQSANITMHVVFSFYAGACALNAITGSDFGTDVGQWRAWWSNYRSAQAASAPQPVAAPTASATPSPTAPSAGGQISANEIVLGGTYRFVLTTGDAFTGKVEVRTDTSVVAETAEGRAYSFRTAIVRECVVVSLPAARAPAVPAGPRQATFEELKARPPAGARIELRIKSGQVFEGTFAGFDGEQIKIDVAGSVIPFHKDVVAQITVGTAKKPDTAAPVAPPKRSGPLDTVIVRNPKTDEWGKRMASYVYAGTITQDYGDRLSITRTDGAVVDIKRSEVERVIRHSAGAADPEIEAVQRYAKTLFCPGDMILVDVPPGVKGRPFMKVCVDKYEYPNTAGSIPKANVSFADAKALCESKGKRLCSVEEWQWGCSGLENLAYAYGQVFNENTCNSSTKGLSGSGSRTNCVSKFGLYDMTGNLFEWVTDNRGQPMMMGGPQSKCQTVSPGTDGMARPLAGLRCCKNN